MKNPAEVLQAAFDAINLDDWGALAGLCDPVSLRLFKQEILGQATATFRKLGEYSDEILETELNDIEDEFDGLFIDPQECLSRELFSVTTLEQLSDMDPGRVFARWIQAKLHRQYRILKPENQSWRGPNCAQSLRTAHGFRFAVLGWLSDGADLAHVVYRNDRDIPGIGSAHGTEIKSSAGEDDLLDRILCVRSFPMTALCRRQADGSWGLIASRNLYLVPSVEIIDAA